MRAAVQTAGRARIACSCLSVVTFANACAGALGQDEATVELDFQTAQEQREPFEASDFTLPLSGEPGDGNIQAFFGTIDTVPALATLPDEISQVRPWPPVPSAGAVVAHLVWSVCVHAVLTITVCSVHAAGLSAVL